MDQPAAPPGFAPVDASRALGRDGSASFEALVGPLYRDDTRTTPDETVWGFHAETRHCNPYGVVHGGMLTTLADTMMGSLVYRRIDGAPCATISLTTEFIRAGHAGQWIEARARLLRVARAVAFVECSVSADGSLAMTAHGTWAIIQKK